MEVLVLLWIMVCPVQSTNSEISSDQPLSLMFYNVENLFFPGDDSLTRDNEFTPEGSMHWTMSRYHRKITAIVKVILAAGSGNLPVVIGLCEIENETVLQNIIHHPLLVKYDYRIIHHDSPDPRGIDVALLYRDGFSPVEFAFHTIHFPGLEDQTREILHVLGVTTTGDSLDILVNHWTSRYGDAVGSASKRLYQAITLNKIRDSLLHHRADPLVVAMGDFNDGFLSDPLMHISETENTFIAKDHFDNPAISGTYKYQGRWETIDHFIITSKTGHLQFIKKVFSSPWLLEPDERYTGIKPARTYIGQTYAGGISDHLPVILEVIDPWSPVH